MLRESPGEVLLLGLRPAADGCKFSGKSAVAESAHAERDAQFGALPALAHAAQQSMMKVSMAAASSEAAVRLLVRPVVRLDLAARMRRSSHGGAA